MVSINSTSNSFVLSNLRQIGSDLATAQNRISTGLKVASARDNASVWSTAQTIRKEISATNTAKDGLASTKAQVEIAYQALNSMAEVITKMQTAATGLKDRAAGAGTADVAAGESNAAIQAQLVSYQAELMALTKTASFNGKNLIADTGGTFKAVVGKNGTADIELTVTSEQILTTAGTGGSLYTATSFASVYGNTAFATGTTITSTERDAYTGALTAGLKAVNDYAAKLAGFSDSITAQQTFIGKVNDIRNTALSSLVDADMEVESAKISALQVKEQLSYQALSIANQSAQNVLRLFQ